MHIVLTRSYRLVAALLLALILAAPAGARDFVIVVDTSGSMLEDFDGKKINPNAPKTARIQAVRDALSRGVSDLPDDTRVTLIEFNTGVKKTNEFRFSEPGARERAREWIEALAPPPNGNTHLWVALREALAVARRYREQSRQAPILRIYTDGKNEVAKSQPKAIQDLSLDAVLREFPEADGSTQVPEIVLLSKTIEQSARTSMRKEAAGRAIFVDDPGIEVRFPLVLTWRPAQPIAGQPVTFINRSRGNYTGYRWSLDDKVIEGQKDAVLDLPSLTAGKHKITLAAAYRSGEPETKTGIVEVAPQKMPPPDATFTASKTAFNLGDEIELRPKIHQPGWKHEWFIGEQQLAGDSVKWKGDRDGEVKVRHRVTAPHGSSEAEQVLVGRKLPPPPAAFTPSKTVFEPGSEVEFRPREHQPGWEHEWFIGDEHLKGETVKWKGDRTGEVKVRHRVTGPQGSAEEEIVIVGRKSEIPVVKFRADPMKGRVPVKVQFHDETTLPESIARYEWDFGDGSPKSGERHPAHEYSKPDTYTPKLRVTTRQQEQFESKESPRIVAQPPPTWIERNLPWLVLAGAALLLGLLGWLWWLKSLPTITGRLTGEMVVDLVAKKARRILVLPLSEVTPGLASRIEFRFSGSRHAPQREAAICGAAPVVNSLSKSDGEWFDLPDSMSTTIEVEGHTVTYDVF